LKDGTFATFIGENFCQEIQNQRLEVCGGIFRQKPIFYVVVSLTDLVAENSAKNLIFTGCYFRQELHNFARKFKSPTAWFSFPLYIFHYFKKNK
jgi:hypothetical protein